MDPPATFFSSLASFWILELLFVWIAIPNLVFFSNTLTEYTKSSAVLYHDKIDPEGSKKRKRTSEENENDNKEVNRTAHDDQVNNDTNKKAKFNNYTSSSRPPQSKKKEKKRMHNESKNKMRKNRE